MAPDDRPTVPSTVVDRLFVYGTLRPGETRELEAAYAAKDLGGAVPVVTIDGWNVAGPAGR